MEIVAKQELKEETKYQEKVIEIEKAGKPRKTRIRAIPITWDGKPEVVWIKKMSYGERGDFSENFMNIEMIGQATKTSISIKKMGIKALTIGIHSAPFPATEDYIEHELPGEIGELLYKEVELFNELNPGLKKKSDMP